MVLLCFKERLHPASHLHPCTFTHLCTRPHTHESQTSSEAVILRLSLQTAIWTLLSNIIALILPASPTACCPYLLCSLSVSCLFSSPLSQQNGLIPLWMCVESPNCSVKQEGITFAGIIGRIRGWIKKPQRSFSRDNTCRFSVCKISLCLKLNQKTHLFWEYSAAQSNWCSK